MDFWTKMDQVTWDFMDKEGNEFFSFLLSNVEMLEDPNAPYKTAWTNGPQMGFHPEFVEICNREELVGVVYHELQHIIYEHCSICVEMDLDHDVHNIACDHYNNLEAATQGFILPAHITPYRDKKFKGMSSMAIYDYLMQDENEQERKKQIQQLEDGSGLGKDIAPLPAGMSPEEAKEVAQDMILQAVIQADMAGAPGSVPSDVRRMYEEVTAPRMDWWTILLRKMTSYAKDDWSLRRPNRRHKARGIYLPTLFNECLGSIAFGFDVSGSMSDAELGLCVAIAKDIRNMLKPQETHIMCFDTEVHECGTFQAHHPLKEIKLVGGGGTDVNPFLELCRDKNPDIMICFTDGGFFSPPAQHDVDPEALYWVLTEKSWCKDLVGTEILMEVT